MKPPVVVVLICGHGVPKCVPCWMCERDASGRWYYWPPAPTVTPEPRT